jgi:hypothetical protein
MVNDADISVCVKMGMLEKMGGAYCESLGLDVSSCHKSVYRDCTVVYGRKPSAD